MEDLVDATLSNTLTFSEVYDAITQRIYDYNPIVNAIIKAEPSLHSLGTFFDSKKRKKLPLYGIPFGVKDLIFTSGMSTTCGTPTLDLLESESEFVTLLRSKGAECIVKCNTPPFGMDIQTINELYGTCKNPYDIERTSGGSSGGSAVAVALGMIYFALGTDMNGSLRIPASYCGVVSYKPSFGMVSQRGMAPPIDQTMRQDYLTTIGLITRTVTDLHYIVKCIEYDKATNKNLTRAGKIVVTPKFENVETDDTLVRTLEAMDKTVDNTVDFEVPAIGHKQIVEAHKVLAEHHLSADSENLSKFIPSLKPPPEDSVEWALQIRSKLRNFVDAFIGDRDIWILPATPSTAFPHNPNHCPIRINDVWVNYWKATVSYSTLFSLTGNPVITIPLRLVNGLPIGIQLVGKYGEDFTLLNVAISIEKKIGFQPPGKIFEVSE